MTFVSRADAAVRSGAPLGTIADVARTTSTDADAKVVATSFGNLRKANGQPVFSAAPTGLIPAASTERTLFRPSNAPLEVPDPNARQRTPYQSRWDDPEQVTDQLTTNFWRSNRGLWDNIGSALSKTGWAALDASSAPQYYTVRGVKTLLRAHDEIHKDNSGIDFGSAADWRTAWNDSRHGSLGQMAVMDIWGDPVTGKRDYQMLDDPEATYAFFEGDDSTLRARDVSGAVDFIANFMDPTIVIGGAIGAARKAAVTYTAEDVAKIADEATPLSMLSGKQRVGRQTVTDIVDTFAERKAGTASALARTDIVRRSGNGEALAYFLDRVGRQDGLDEAARRGLGRDALYAMMGDGKAAERVGQYNNRLRSEIEMSRVDPTKVDVSAWLDPMMDDELRATRIFQAANDDEALQREIRVHQDWLQGQLQAGTNIADSAAGVVNGRGDLATKFGRRDLNAVTGRGAKAKIATYKNGVFLRPLNVVSGDYLPHVFQLSQPEKALDSFAEATDRAIVELRKVPKARETLLGMRDAFVSAGQGATGRATRDRIVNDFNKFVDDSLAERHGLDPERYSEVTRRAARARELAITGLSQRIYKALNGAGDRVLSDTERADLAHYLEGDADEMLALPYSSGAARQLIEIGQAEQERLMLRQQAITAEQNAVTAAESPILRSQTRDLVSIVDAREKAHLARAFSATGFDGFIRRGATKGWEWTEAGLSTVNNFFKLATLFRPAYALRIQVDTQARMLAVLGPLEQASAAWGGSKNMAYNRLHRISEAESFDLEERLVAQGRLRDAEERLSGINPTALGRHRIATERLSDLSSSTAKKRLEAARERHPSGRAKGMSADAKAALSARLEAEHAAEVARIQGEADSALADLGGATPEDVAYWQSVAKGARERLAADRPEPAGKKVRVGKTVAQRHVGQGDRINADGTIVQAGKRKEITSAYNSAEEYRRSIQRIDATDSTANLFTSRTQFEVQTRRGGGEWHYTQGWDDNWYKAYARAVDWQTLGDALGKRVIAAQDDEGLRKVLTWLEESPEGNAYLRDMRRISGQDYQAVDLLQRASDHIETLLPQGSPVRAAAQQGHVSKADILSTWKSEAGRPQVPHESEAALTMLAPAKLAYNSFRERFFKMASSIPENMLGRQPFYQARFKAHAQEMIRGLDDEAVNGLSSKQIDAIRARAANRARRDVGRYLFDTSRQSNIGHMMRFIAPFYAAWADTMVKWSRIFAENPGIFAVAAKIPSAPNQLGLVTDEDGNRVDKDGVVYDADGNKTDRRINPFEGMISLPGLPKFLQEKTGQKNLKFTKASANVIFQGDPFWLPGNGPLVTIPASVIVNESFGTLYPEDEDNSPGAAVMRYFLPYGPEAGNPLQVATQSLTPSFGTAGQAWMDSKSALAVSEFNTLYANEFIREQQTGQYLSDEERFAKVSKQTKNSLFMRFMGTYVAPVSLQNNSPLEYYVQQYRQYISELGYDKGHDAFLEDYPDYLALTVSLSKNTTGLQANDETAIQIKRYRDNMATDPDKAWFWAGAANLAPGFNSAVYGNESTQAIGTGTNKTFRTKKDPLDVATDISVADGWQKYTAFNTALETKMKDMGITSLQSNAAINSGLTQIKSDYIAQMRDANPAWSEAYDAQNSVGNAQSIIRYAADNLDDIKDDPMLGHDAWLEFFATRAKFQGALARLGVKSMDSKTAEESGLSAAWDAAMLDLTTRSDAFSVAWSRGLSSDDLAGDVYTLEGVGN